MMERQWTVKYMFLLRVAKNQFKTVICPDPHRPSFVWENENAPSSHRQPPRDIHTSRKWQDTGVWRGCSGKRRRTRRGKQTVISRVSWEHNLKHVTWPPGTISWLETEVSWLDGSLLPKQLFVDVNEISEGSGINNYKELESKPPIISD